MKKVLVFVLFSLFGNLFALDTIFKKDSKMIFCNVIAISSGNVTYLKKESELSYPVFIIPKSMIRYIEFESGKKVFFTERIRKPRSIPKIVVDSVEVDSAKVDSFKIIDTIKIDIIKVDSILFDTIAIDTIKIDTVKLDSIAIDTVEIDTLEAEIEEIDTVPIIEKIKKEFKIKPYIKRRYTVLLGFGSTKATFDNSVNDYNSSLGSFTVGGYRNFHLTPLFTLKAGAFMSFRKGEFEESKASESQPFSTESEKVTVSVFDLDFSALINYGVFVEKYKRVRIYVDVGPRLSISLVRNYLADFHSDQSTTTIPTYSSNELNLFNIGGVVAIGTELYNRFIIEAKYDFDITNRYKNDNKCTYSSTWIMLGYEF